MGSSFSLDKISVRPQATAGTPSLRKQEELRTTDWVEIEDCRADGVENATRGVRKETAFRSGQRNREVSTAMGVYRKFIHKSNNHY